MQTKPSSPPFHPFHRLRPSLFYLLANFRRVPLDRLIHALCYQSERLPELRLSFSQILIAFNDLHHAGLAALHADFGEVDDDPLGHLLVDTGRIDLNHLHRLQLQAHGASIATVMHQPNLTDALYDELSLIDAAASQRELAYEVLQKRQMAMAFLKSRLSLSGLLSPEHFQILGLALLQYLPLRYKPLMDVMVLCGEWPDFLQNAIMVEHIGLDEEPLLKLLCRPGLLEPSALARLRRLYDPNKDRGVNPAVLLVEKGLISRGEIVMAVQQAYTHLAQSRLDKVGSR